MPNIYSLLSESALSNILSNPSIAATIKQLKLESMNTFKMFSSNLKNVKKRASYIYDIFIDSDSNDQQQNREIAEAFKETVGNSLDELDKYLDEQEHTKEEMLFFESTFVEQIINILESILQFQNKLNASYPGASEKIIDFCGNLLIALISIQMPVVGLILKGSGLLDSVKSFLSTENLTKIVDNWKAKLEIVEEKLVKIEKHSDLKEKYCKAKQISEIAETTGASPVAIATLGLDVDSLNKINKLVRQDPQEKDSFKKLIDLSEKTPYSKSDIIEAVGAIRDDTNKILGHIPNKEKYLKNLIEPELCGIKENLLATLNPNKSVIDKLECCYKATKNIFTITSQIQEAVKLIPDREKIVTSFVNLVKDKTQNILPAHFLQDITSLKTTLKPLSALVQIGNAMKVALGNSSSKAQSVVKER
ncbi:hypothetical protein [Candidatus Tisiphia endosymbiont of Oplodontha viridula]|uniref:hypothetical protein n=1 Tax=Candidatus Tisiphia endosymbiont of Oplodontha viridula TaxID=3077925 RepID=UPI0035C93792